MCLLSGALSGRGVGCVQFAGLGLGGVAAVGAGALKKADEGGDLFGRELVEHFAGHGLNDGVHLS